MTTEEQQNLQKALSNRELLAAKQLALQAARNLQPGSAPTASSVPSVPRQSSPNPLPNPPTLTPTLTMQHSLDKQIQSQNGVKHGMLYPQSKLFAGINNTNFAITPQNSAAAQLHLRNRLSPSNSPSPSVVPPRSSLPPASAPNMSAIHQQMLNADLYSAMNRGTISATGSLRHSRSESNPSPSQMRMNGGLAASHAPQKRTNDDITRNGHSQKMVHTYASGKSSPVGPRASSAGGTKPPMYPIGTSSAQAMPPTTAPVLRSASLNGSLSARVQPRRSSVGSPSLGGEENGYPQSQGGRHARNNSTPGQLNGVVNADYATAMLLQQQKQRQVLQQQIGGGNSSAEQMLQQQQMMAIQKEKQLMQELLLQSSSNASATEVLNRIAATDLPLPLPLSLPPQPQRPPLQSTLPSPTPQLSLPTLTPQQQSSLASPYVPSKLELYAQLLGGSEVAESNLAAIPELEAQLFSAVADCLHVLMMGESVEEVLTNIMAIAQFTKSEQAQMHVPMPRAFASWLRRVALIMPLITAVYQDRSQKLTVREGFATLIRIFAEPYPLLSDQLESLMGMGEAAAACVLDSSNLWRQVIALLQDKEIKLHNMEVKPLTNINY